MTKLDFLMYARQLASNNNVQMMLPVIEKELLHYEILLAMDKFGLLSNLVFQGGTCLRLCYGSQRYSEDLDFAGGVDFTAGDLKDLRKCIALAIPERYSVNVDVLSPSKEKSLVKKWRIKIDTAPERPDLPAQKISVEIASIPAYTKQARMLQLNYDGLPASYADIIVPSESLEEILADKMQAFVCSHRIRYRDIWDMFWIMRRPVLNLEEAYRLRALKEVDYSEQTQFKKGICRVKNQLGEIVQSQEFSREMMRFLPADLYDKTMGRAEYRSLMIEGIQNLYAEDGSLHA